MIFGVVVKSLNNFTKLTSVIFVQIDHCVRGCDFHTLAIWSALTFGNDNYCTRAPESGRKKLIAKCGLIYKIKLSSARDGPTGAGRNENALSVCVYLHVGAIIIKK